MAKLPKLQILNCGITLLFKPIRPALRLCHNGKNATFCHSERSEESDLPMSYANEILRLTPKNDIVTQSACVINKD